MIQAGVWVKIKDLTKRYKRSYSILELIVSRAEMARYRRDIGNKTEILLNSTTDKIFKEQLSTKRPYRRKRKSNV